MRGRFSTNAGRGWKRRSRDAGRRASAAARGSASYVQSLSTPPDPIGTFYAGILDYGDAAPDFEGLAEAVNFLRASNVKVMVATPPYD